jgi:hypothetical protein
LAKVPAGSVAPSSKPLISATISGGAVDG